MPSSERQLASSPVTGQALVRIPEGWFFMGSDSGQDCERPVHRVWIDAFLLSATQVTNTEYDHFLRATATVPPPFWKDANFNHPQRAVFPDRLDHRFHGVQVANVARECMDRALGGEFFRRVVEDFFAASADVDFCTEFEEAMGHAFAEAGASAGDEDALLFEKVGLEHAIE